MKRGHTTVDVYNRYVRFLKGQFAKRAVPDLLEMLKDASTGNLLRQQTVKQAACFGVAISRVLQSKGVSIDGASA